MSINETFPPWREGFFVIQLIPIKKMILCIETSTMSCSVALTKVNNCWILKEEKDSADHAQKLTGFIQSVLTQGNVKLQNIDAIAVSSGPGSYTGLRIGISVAKGFCYSLEKPLIAVNSLHSLAYGASIKDLIQEHDIIVALQDARRMDAYAAVYNAQLEEIAPPQFLSLEADSFQKWATPSGRIWLCGNAATKMPLEYKNLRVSQVIGSSAHYLEQLAYQKWEQKAFEDLAYFEPFYLKPPNITKPKPNKYFNP